MGEVEDREALIEDLWPLVKTDGHGARERTRRVLEELDRRRLLKPGRGLGPELQGLFSRTEPEPVRATTIPTVLGRHGRGAAFDKRVAEVGFERAQEEAHRGGS